MKHNIKFGIELGIHSLSEFIGTVTSLTATNYFVSQKLQNNFENQPQNQNKDF